MKYNIEEEIQIVYNVITHPAGFSLNLFDGDLWVNKSWNCYKVSWTTYWSNDRTKFEGGFNYFGTAFEAATFFCQMRHERQLGMDYKKQ